ncbi:hypothetical protein ACFVAJ_18885 [Agromyces sp. NPDC057679]|uniref:hypothetical protein n=1 Tax=Agromyces sp. NPDC057679 TaxID=3346207 RepID=UPI00366CDB5D
MKHTNPELAQAMRELRKSSAASPHEDRRTKRARTRSASKARSVAEQADRDAGTSRA